MVNHNNAEGDDADDPLPVALAHLQHKTLVILGSCSTAADEQVHDAHHRIRYLLEAQELTKKRKKFRQKTKRQLTVSLLIL